MTEVFISLTVIMVISALVPLVARIIPGQIVPETVLLIAGGALLGPNMYGIIQTGYPAIEFLSEMGCAFLFLLAGYEIDPKSVTGKDGIHGLWTWCATFAIALLVSLVTPSLASGRQGLIATSLLCTTTALGTLMPILKDRGLTDTRVGQIVISYGTWGELAVILAVAVLLGARTTWQITLILGVFFALCVWIAHAGARAKSNGGKVYRFLVSRSESTSQTFVRMTVLILVMLVTFSSVFQIDIVLGAFAAGFILRYIVPEGNEVLETKLDGMAHGFFIPLFFVVSGARIDLGAVASRPMIMIFFIVALILIRSVPIIVSLSVRKSTREKLSLHNRIAAAAYCTTALPLIVAITTICVKRGIMEEDVASVLIAAGAITVFLMPFVAAVTYRVADAEPISAIVEIAHHPESTKEIVSSHVMLERRRARYYKLQENRLRVEKRREERREEIREDIKEKFFREDDKKN